MKLKMRFQLQTKFNKEINENSKLKNKFKSRYLDLVRAKENLEVALWASGDFMWRFDVYNKKI